MVLRAADGVWAEGAGRSSVTPPAYSVVLLHGWQQDFGDLLIAAQQLRDTLGVDVLLLDFYAHGRSPCLPSVGMHTVKTLVLQIRRIIGIIAWESRPLVIGGFSMGASVALHYATAYPDHVCGLLLGAPSGMPEGPLNPAHIAKGVGRVLVGEVVEPQLQAKEPSEHCEQSSLARRFLSRLGFERHCPDYLVDETVWSCVLERRWPILVIAGRYDFLHTPQVDQWKLRAPWADVQVVPMTHWWLCLHPHDLGLPQQDFWVRVANHLSGAQAVANPKLTTDIAASGASAGTVFPRARL